MRQPVLPRRPVSGRPTRAGHRRRLGARPLLALRRHPRWWWAVVGLASLGAGWTVASVVARAESASAAWGSGEVVAVAADDLAPGTVIGPGDVELARRPGPTVPEGALDQLPHGRTVRAAVVKGEIVVAARLAPGPVSPLAARLPEGTRAVAIPVEPGTAPPLEPGDLVDVLVALAPESAGAGPPGFVLTPSAVVVDVGEHAVTVAVPPDAAPRVAVALASGAVSLALTAP